MNLMQVNILPLLRAYVFPQILTGYLEQQTCFCKVVVVFETAPVLPVIGWPEAVNLQSHASLSDAVFYPLYPASVLLHLYLRYLISTPMQKHRRAGLRAVPPHLHVHCGPLGKELTGELGIFSHHGQDRMGRTRHSKVIYKRVTQRNQEMPPWGAIRLLWDVYSIKMEGPGRGKVLFAMF